jgi:hypothetical protein
MGCCTSTEDQNDPTKH